jgi:hypothetical protein
MPALYRCQGVNEARDANLALITEAEARAAAHERDTVAVRIQVLVFHRPLLTPIARPKAP